MRTYLVTLDSVIGADRQPEGCVWVQCNLEIVRGTALVTRELTVQIDGHSVAVFEETAPGGTPSDILVATTLVDATRRLFGLVGRA